MGVISEILAPSVVTGIVSRIRTPGNPLSRFFGVEIGGKNVNRISGRSYSWDIFDNVRDAAHGRAPGTGPFVVAANPVGRQTNTFPRAYQKLPMNYELLHNIRQLGANAGTRDRMGATYIENQGRMEKLKHENWRELMWALMLTQGTISWQFSGDDWIPVASLGANLGFTLDYLVPAGNKSAAIPGLNPLGSGNIIDASWATASTNIPKHLDQINQAFQQLVGAPLALAITDSTVWNNVLNNTTLQAQGGSVNAVFAEYDMEPMKGPDGNLLGVFVARLRARPWLKWLIVDTGLNINGTYTRFFDGNHVTFMIEPDPYWLTFQEGSEPAKQNPMAPVFEAFGFTSWLREWDEPARVELHTLQNAVPELRIPKALMQAKVS